MRPDFSVRPKKIILRNSKMDILKMDILKMSKNEKSRGFKNQVLLGILFIVYKNP
jgi:hypothetical protein